MSPPIKVLHLTECLSLGGAGRALIGLVKFSLPDGVTHSLVSLTPCIPQAAELAHQAGLIILPYNPQQLPQLIAAADIVQINFWNSPALYAALAQSWGPTRIATWCLISGDHAPQLLHQAVVDFSDALIASTTHTRKLPLFQRAAASKLLATVISTPDFSRLQPLERKSVNHLTIGYVGTVDFVKMHPDFVKLHAALSIPGLRVRVCGEGNSLDSLRQQAKQTADPARFEFLGFRESIAEVLATCDIFGYPLAPENYATSELALQEAMFLGVPAVLWASGGPTHMVQHEVTGLLASNAHDYIRQVERLAAEPILRRTLGQQAATFARTHWGAERSAQQMNLIYRRLMEKPKVSRPPCPIANATSGATRFVNSLGSAAPQFEVSLAPDRHPLATVQAADRLIANSSTLLASPASGGVLHYRFNYPSDVYLRFWSGLILHRQGRTALAALEFHRALAGGIDLARIQPYHSTTTKAEKPKPILPDAPSGTPTSPETVVRAGLANAMNRLLLAPEDIAYVGNSVTGQRDGYRPLLHQWLQDWSGQAHRSINLGLGGIGSFGAAFFLAATLKKRTPALCFVECLTGDLGSKTPLDAIGAVVEGIVRQLIANGCSICFLYLYEHRQHSSRGRAISAIYEAIADHYQVPSLHLGSATEKYLSHHALAAHCWFRDDVHTRAAAAFYVVKSIGAAWHGLAWPRQETEANDSAHSRRAINAPRSLLHAEAYCYPEIERPKSEDFPNREGVHWDSFQLVEKTLVLAPPMGFTAAISAGEIVGLLYINGPTTDALDVTGSTSHQRFLLRDKWSYYERLQVFRFPEPVAAGIVLQLRPVSSGENPCSPEATENPTPVLAHKITLALIGLLVRKPSSSPIHVSLKLLTA